MQSYEVEPYTIGNGSMMKLETFYCETLEELKVTCYNTFPNADYFIAMNEFTQDIYTITPNTIYDLNCDEIMKQLFLIISLNSSISKLKDNICVVSRERKI